MTSKPTVSVDRGQIVAAALAMIDDRGLAEFGIRPLAAEMGINTMTIYWHVGDLDTLLAEVVESAVRSAGPVVEEGDDWTETVLVAMRRTRESLLRHPNVVPLVFRPGHLSPILVHTAAHLLSVLRRAGYAPATALDVAQAATWHTMGFVMRETHLPVEGVDVAEVRRAVAGDDVLEPDVIEELTRHLVTGRRNDVFEWSLRALLQGLRVGLEDGSTPPPSDLGPSAVVSARVRTPRAGAAKTRGSRARRP